MEFLRVKFFRVNARFFLLIWMVALTQAEWMTRNCKASSSCMGRGQWVRNSISGGSMKNCCCLFQPFCSFSLNAYLRKKYWTATAVRGGIFSHPACYVAKILCEVPMHLSLALFIVNICLVHSSYKENQQNIPSLVIMPSEMAIAEIETIRQIVFFEQLEVYTAHHFSTHFSFIFIHFLHFFVFYIRERRRSREPSLYILRLIEHKKENYFPRFIPN